MKNELSKIPAFGIEPSSGLWGAKEAHENVAQHLLKKNAQKNSVNPEEAAKGHRLLTNIMKILECLPLIGIFIGLLSLLDFCTKTARKNYSIHFVERHLIAASGVGFIVLPLADIIATVKRNSEAKKSTNNANQPNS